MKYTGLRTDAFNPPVLPPRCMLVYDDPAKVIYISRPASVGYDAFMDTFTSLTSLQKVPGADPDFDGISNPVEHALAGFDPTVADPSPGISYTLPPGQPKEFARIKIVRTP